MKLSSSSGALHRVRLPHQGCSVEATAVRLRRTPRPPTRILRKSQSHHLARPRGGWVTGLDPADGLIGRSTRSRPLVGSGVLGNRSNRRLASKSLASGARLFSGIEVLFLFMVRRFLSCSYRAPTSDLLETDRLPSSVLRKLILSLDYRYSMATRMRPPYDRRIASTLPLHDLQNHPNVCYPHGTFLSHLYTEVSVLLPV